MSFDGETQSDLERIVEAMRGQRGRVLWCGSAGLAEVLIAAHFDAATEGSTSLGQQAAAAATAAGPRVARRPLLAVVGSTSEATQRQLDAATTFGRAGLVRLDPAASFEQERRRLAAELRRLEAAPSAPADAPPRLILAAPAERQIAHVVSRCLASAAVAFLEHSPVAGLFLTGGETAYEVARAASVRGMLIEEELFPGIPLVRFLGGKLDGLPGVTKAGGFGDETTLIRSFDAIAALGLRRG